MTYQKAAHWHEPKNKLFRYQVGFTCPPQDYDASAFGFPPHVAAVCWCAWLDAAFS